MDSGSLITGGIILLILIIPFIFLGSSVKKRKKKILSALEGLAQKNNCKITKYDVWNDTAIGLDETAKSVFFYKKIKMNEIFIPIMPDQFQKSRVANSSRVIKNEAGNYTVIDRLELVLTPREKGVPETILEFFNAGSDFSSLSEELELSSTWNETINNCFRK